MVCWGFLSRIQDFEGVIRLELVYLLLHRFLPQVVAVHFVNFMRLLDILWNTD